MRCPLGWNFAPWVPGLVRGEYQPAGLHAAEASCVSSSALSSFRAAIVRSVWSGEMPLASTLIRCLLDGPWGVDPAFHVTWARLRMMRRYLDYCPEEESRFFFFLDAGPYFSWVQGVDRFIFCLPLLLSWDLLGMVRKRVKLGLVLSAPLYFYFGCLAASYVCPVG